MSWIFIHTTIIPEISWLLQVPTFDLFFKKLDELTYANIYIRKTKTKNGRKGVTSLFQTLAWLIANQWTPQAVSR